MIKNLVNSKFGRASALSIMLPLSFAANADNHCADLDVRDNFVLSSSASAYNFSTKTEKIPNITNVGVAIVEGTDLQGFTPHQVGQHIIKKLESKNDEREKQGLPIINAECFVADFKSPNGTSVMYKVEGLTVPYSNKGLNLDIALHNDTYVAVRGEASLVKTAKLDVPVSDGV